MKKLSNWLIVALLTIIILALPGCAFGSASATPSATAFPTATETPSPTLTPTSTPTPTPTLSPTPTLPPKEAFLDGMEEAPYGDLYRVKFPVNSGRISYRNSLFKAGDKLISVDYLYKNFLENPVVFDPKTGVHEASEKFNPLRSGCVGLADDKTIYQVNTSSKEWVLYDLSLKEIKRFTLAGGILENESNYVIDGARNEVFYKKDTQNILAYNYQTGEQIETPALDGILGIFDIVKLSNNSLGVYSSVDVSLFDSEREKAPCIAIYDMNTHSFTGEVIQDNPDLFYKPDGSELFAVELAPYIKAGLYDIATASFGNTIRFKETEEIEHFCIDWTNRCFLTYRFASSSDTAYEELRCYSMDSGELLASAVVPEKAFGFATPVILEDLGIMGIYGTDEGENGSDKEAYIYYWDYVSSESHGVQEYYERQHSVSNKLKKYADALEKKYEIFFYLGHDVLASEFAYELTVCTDENLMYNALQKIDKVLGSYPENFFKQIKSGSTRTLGIYLCQGLVEKEDGLASDAIAFASGVEYERSIVLDVDFENELMRTLYHEISHWIDSYIEEMNSFGICSGYEDGWNALNPEGFKYLDSYKNYKKRTKYTYFNERDFDKVYFVDAYSTTTGGEDRARLFEYLMEEDAQNFYKCPHVIEKLEYRFKAIREAFVTTGWPEKTSWEEKLDQWKKRNKAE